MTGTPRLYIACVTRAQIERVQELNQRSKEEPRTIGNGFDAVTIVDPSDPRADMIGGRWFGITIGILPDGSAHS